MRVWIAGMAAGLLATAAPEQGGAEEERPALTIVLPSGLEAGLQEVRAEQTATGAPLLRARYVAPGLAVGAPLKETSADLEFLCNTDALPRLESAGGREAARIVVSLADAPSVFGVPAPDVHQVFEAFTVEGDLCIWEAF